MARGRMTGGASGNSAGVVPEIGSTPPGEIGGGQNNVRPATGLPGSANVGSLNKLPKYNTN